MQLLGDILKSAYILGIVSSASDLFGTITLNTVMSLVPE